MAAVRLEKSEAGKVVRHVLSQPPRQLWCAAAIARDRPDKRDLGLVQRNGVPRGALFAPDAFANLEIRVAADGILGKAELAAVPSVTRICGTADGAQPGAVIGCHELEDTHAGSDQASQEALPVNFGLRQGHGHTEHAPPRVRAARNQPFQNPVTPVSSRPSIRFPPSLSRNSME